MTVYNVLGVQVSPDMDDFSVKVTNVANTDHWLKFKSDGREFLEFLIHGATHEEAEIIAAAINAPYLRIRAEKDAGK